MKSLYHGKKQLTSKQNKVLSYKLREGDKSARTQMIEGNAGFAYGRAIKYSKMNQGWGHIDSDDLLQAALMGLVEAVDRYDPDTGYSFTTYAHFWIVKRIAEEIGHRHWNTLRPPRNAMRSFLYKKLDYDGSTAYVDKFMYRGGTEVISETTEEGYISTEIRYAVSKAKLTKSESRIFNALYGENEKKDKLSDLTKKQIADIENSMLDKLREQFE